MAPAATPTTELRKIQLALRVNSSGSYGLTIVQQPGGPNGAQVLCREIDPQSVNIKILKPGDEFVEVAGTACVGNKDACMKALHANKNRIPIVVKVMRKFDVPDTPNSSMPASPDTRPPPPKGRGVGASPVPGSPAGPRPGPSGSRPPPPPPSRQGGPTPNASPGPGTPNLAPSPMRTFHRSGN